MPKNSNETYTTLAGEVLRYPKPSPPVREYLARVVAAADDPAITYNELLELVYSRDNPILDPNLLEGRGAVTLETFQNPIYHVMTDLLDRKRMAAGTLDVAAVAAAHTMTVADAAAKLGIGEDAVRRALRAGKLTAWKHGKSYLLDPRSVETYRDRVERRGPRADSALEIRMGSEPGRAFMIKAPNVEVLQKEGSIIDAFCPRFESAAVKFTSKRSDGSKSTRTFLLEPGGEAGEYKHGPFYIRGRFLIAKKINDPQKAADTFREFNPK